MADQDVLRVLIIDDDEHNAKKYGSAVEEHCKRLHQEVRVLTASTASDSLEEMGNLKDKPRVFVFCDNELGKSWKVQDEQCSGLDMLPHIRQALPQARTVLYSAKADPPDIRIALERGAYDMVTRQSFDAASKGLLTVLAQMAAIEQRMAEAQAGEDGDTESADPLARLLMKIRTSLMVVGRHGRIWFQNKPNEDLYLSEALGGEIFFRCFHEWTCSTGSFSWHPVMKSMLLGRSIERTLLLPMRQKKGEDAFRIGCVRMLSEPLWPLGGAASKVGAPCAGALVSSTDCTPEWKTKPAANRMLDLLVMIAQLLHREQVHPLQVNLYQIRRSQTKCQAAVCCIVQGANTGQHAHTNEVSLIVGSTLAVSNTALTPGPATEVHLTEGTVDESLPGTFSLSEHPAGNMEAKTDAAMIQGVTTFHESPHSIQPLFGHCDQSVGAFHYLVLNNPDDPRHRLAILEGIGIDGDSCLGHCSAGKAKHKCDLDLYLRELAITLREMDRDREVPQAPTFHECDSRKCLWNEVEDAMEELRSAVKPTGGGLWWHFREYVLEEDSFGQSRHLLRLASDAASIGKSPYIKYACCEESCQDVELPSPRDWDDDEREKIALSNCFVSSPPDGHGSRSCRISGRPRLCHEAPSKDGNTNLAKVIRLANEKGDTEAVRLLNAIQSFGDFPVGKKVEPVGTFHIQSTVNDVFSHAVFKYLIGVAAGIERALLRIRAHEKARELDRLELKRERERLIRDHLAGRTTRIAEMLDVEPESLDRDLLRSLARSVSFHQSLLDDRLAPTLTNLENQADFNKALARAAASVRRECKANPMFARFGDDSLEYASPAAPIYCRADEKALAEAFASSLLAAMLYGQDAPRVKAELSSETTGNKEVIRFSVRFPGRLDHELKILEDIWTSDADPANLRQTLLKDNPPSQLRAALLELACARLMFALGVAAETTPSSKTEGQFAVFTMDFHPT